MTREEATIQSLMCHIEALEETIKALEQEPSGDLISRQAVLNTLDRMDKALDTDRTVESYKELLTECYKALPPVKQEPKAGRWISTSIQGEVDGQIIKAFVCSECGAISVFRMTDGKIVNGDLCPNCGAKMVEPQKSEG